MVVFKCSFGSENRRFTILDYEVSFDSLIEKTASVFKLKPSDVVLKYQDEDGDKVTMSCDEDLQDRMDMVENDGVLKLFVSTVMAGRPDNDGFVILRQSSSMGKDEVEVADVDEKQQQPLNESILVSSSEKRSPSPSYPKEIPMITKEPSVDTAPPSVAVHEEDQDEDVKDENSVEQTVHKDVRCDICNTVPIIGVRYKCAICKDYDLCEKCEMSNSHNPMHPLIKMRIPRDYSQVRTVVREQSQSPRRGRQERGKSFAKYVGDVTIPDRSSCNAGEIIEKVWRLQNNGKYSWPAGYKAIMVSGDEKIIDQQDMSVNLPEVAAGHEFDVKVHINVPQEQGRYVAYYRLVNLDNEKFGPRFWVDFYVPEGKPQVAPVVAPVDQPEPEPEKDIPYKAQMGELRSLGFTDDSLNLYLLGKFDGDSVRVVNWLLDQAQR